MTASKINEEVKKIDLKLANEFIETKLSSSIFAVLENNKSYDDKVLKLMNNNPEFLHITSNFKLNFTKQ